MSNGNDVSNAGHRGRISISSILWLLIAALIVPQLIFSAIAFHRNNQAQQAMLTTLAEATVSSIADSIDRQINGMIMTLRALSASEALQSGRLAEFYAHSAQALRQSDTFLVLADEKMMQLFNTRVPYGLELPDITDIVTGERAFATGEPAISGVFSGRTTGQWEFNVMLPVQQKDGSAYLLILSQNVDVLASALSAHNLRGGWNAMIVDSANSVVASSVSWSDVGKPFFLASNQQISSGHAVLTSIEHNGANYEAVRAISDLTGWQTIVWALASTMRAPMVSAVQLMVFGGMAVIAAGVAIAWQLGGRITRSVRKLAADARRLGAGEHVDEGDYPVIEMAIISQALSQASRERRTAENEIRFLMREVAHRSKNQLTVVSSIAKQTARHARSFAAFQDAFQKRLQGLARSTDLLIAGGVAGIELRALVETQIGPFRPSGAERLEISGASFRLSHQAAQTLGLALHELSTNAAKYGAFAWPEGRLRIEWRQVDDRLEFLWRETVPRIRRSGGSKGFGTEVIERMLGGALEAGIERVLHDNGMEYSFSMPLARLKPDAEEPDKAPDKTSEVY